MTDQQFGVTDNAERRRFELTENGQMAIATYRREGDLFSIPHVEAPPALRGKGTAQRLMQGIADMARANKHRIAPRCSYARHWFSRHPEYADVLEAQAPRDVL